MEEKQYSISKRSCAADGESKMALQFALNRLFIVTANLGTLFENVS